MRLNGAPLTLAFYPARAETNRRFAHLDLGSLDRFYLPPGLTGLVDQDPEGSRVFVEDDNRGAVSPESVATLDGLPFYLSVKGIGSTVDPYAHLPLDRTRAAELSADADVRARLARPRLGLPDGEPERALTGELWLRGSPYGGQGEEHGRIALGISERADLTSIAGFRVAPVVKLVRLPNELEERLRTIHWYRRYPGPMVQEVRLVPSNVRIYFHARQTVGQDVGAVYDLFGIDSAARAYAFELEFVRTAVPMLTLFARTLRHDPRRDRYVGLDYHDVWLDKDAVLAPSGAVYFVDLEGIEEEAVERADVRTRLEDQAYRGLYEFMFAYEQLEQERVRRFGGPGARKAHFRAVVGEALRDDPFVRVRPDGDDAVLEIGNALADEALNTKFPLVDGS